AAGGGRLRRELARHFRARREEPDVGLAEIEGGEIVDGIFLALELDRLADGTIARERIQLGDRKLALLEHANHRLAHETRCAHDGDAKCPVTAHERFVMFGVVETTSAFWPRWRR